MVRFSCVFFSNSICDFRRFAVLGLRSSVFRSTVFVCVVVFRFCPFSHVRVPFWLGLGVRIGVGVSFKGKQAGRQRGEGVSLRGGGGLQHVVAVAGAAFQARRRKTCKPAEYLTLLCPVFVVVVCLAARRLGL